MGKKAKKQKGKALLTVANTKPSVPGSIGRTAVKVDDGAGIAELVKKVVVKDDTKGKGVWEDDDEEDASYEGVAYLGITQNPVRPEYKAAPKFEKKEKVDLSIHVGKPGTGTVTEVSPRGYFKVKTLHPGNSEEITVLCVGESGFAKGDIISFKFSQHLGKLSAVLPSKTGTDNVLSQISKINAPVMNIKFASSLTEKELANVKGVSADGNIVVMA